MKDILLIILRENFPNNSQNTLNYFQPHLAEKADY